MSAIHCDAVRSPFGPNLNSNPSINSLQIGGHKINTVSIITSLQPSIHVWKRYSSWLLGYPIRFITIIIIIIIINGNMTWTCYLVGASWLLHCTFYSRSFVLRILSVAGILDHCLEHLAAGPTCKKLETYGAMHFLSLRIMYSFLCEGISRWFLQDGVISFSLYSSISSCTLLFS